MNCEYGWVSDGGEDNPVCRGSFAGLEAGVARCWTSAVRARPVGGDTDGALVVALSSASASPSLEVAFRVTGEGRAPVFVMSSPATFEIRADRRGFLGSTVSPTEFCTASLTCVHCYTVS